jgi:cyclopropane-fatty-acyl-phospholipid synthase
MKSDEVIFDCLSPPEQLRQAGLLERLAKAQVLKALEQISAGRLVLQQTGERWDFGPQDSDLSVTLRIHHPAFWRAVAFGGSIGAGEAYLAGHWDCNDLPALFRLMVRSQEVQQQMEGGPAWLAGWLQRLLHSINDNSLRGSRRNIAAHYDLGNDFYQLFLDPTLAYSCGIFEGPESTMEQASLAKFDHICRTLQLREGMELLEIGTGWGGFALHAARHYGCRVTTTTISRQQFELAGQRVRQAGLTDRITLLCQDYRQLSGQFDRLVSIEMIEAVGHRHLPVFFATCCRHLKPDGLALIQAITVPDRIYERYRRRPDFINRYIFPGGCCPSLQAMTTAAAAQTDLRLVRLEDFTPHYACTLQHWRRAFLERLPQVRALGYDQRFIRMWDYYLSYCEGGFVEQFTGLLQLLYARPAARIAESTP